MSKYLLFNKTRDGSRAECLGYVEAGDEGEMWAKAEAAYSLKPDKMLMVHERMFSAVEPDTATDKVLAKAFKDMEAAP